MTEGILRGKWSEPGVPHRGWTCEDIEDLGGSLLVCEMCEVQPIRFVHRMRHPAYPHILACGCDCAGNMEGDVEEAKQRDADLRNASSRRKRYPSLKGWHRSQKGNETITKDGYRVTIMPQPLGWGGAIVNVSTGAKFFAHRTHPDVDAAKLAAFDTILLFNRKTVKT